VKKEKQMLMRGLTLGAVICSASAGATFAQDIAAGEASFRKCQVCHDVGDDARIKLGPPLNGLDGRKAGSSDFSYSDGLKNSGLTWNEETFREYIKDPRGKVANTTMMFAGIKDDKEIGDLWAYLKQFAPDGKKSSQ
jgi:cytochrome c